MKFFTERNRLAIIPENAQDELYLEQVLGIRKDASCELKRLPPPKGAPPSWGVLTLSAAPLPAPPDPEPPITEKPA